jgi:ASTRA-associated protein 1
MSLHLFMVPSVDSPSTSERNDELRLLCGYENGGVTLWRFTKRDKRTSVEGVGWEVIWTVKQHAEAGATM